MRGTSFSFLEILVAPLLFLGLTSVICTQSAVEEVYPPVQIVDVNQIACKNSMRGANSLCDRTSEFKIAFEDTDVVDRTVQLPLGEVRGIPCNTDETVTAYLGVPYAKPPVGDLRFKPPQPFDSPYPNGQLLATQTPSPCGSICEGSVRDTSLTSENCLFLNIWVPPGALPGQGKLPVRVFIHGGDLMDCSASDPQWNGCQVASKGKFIHVNMQFRMGPFGMLSHPLTLKESNTTGNWGLLDQQLALRWVQDHIRYFGGDPGQVVLDGHSRGAQMVNFQTVIPGSRGLFASAISQSAPCVKFRTLEQGYYDSQKFMKAVRCAPLDSPEAELACMRKLPFPYLFNMTKSMQNGRPMDILLCDQYSWQPTFHHVIDGTVVPRQVMDAYRTGEFNKVPLLVGVTTEEAGGMGVPFFYDGVSGETVDSFIASMFPGADPKPILDAYSIQHFADSADPEGAQLGQIWSDFGFTCPTHERMAARSSNADASTYFYWWAPAPSCPPESRDLGPTHGTDLWFTFAITDGFTSTVTRSGTCEYTPKEVHLSQEIVYAHRSMASYREPRWLNGTAWQKYDPINEIGTYLNVESKSERISFRDRCTVLFQAKQLNEVPEMYSNPNIRLME